MTARAAVIRAATDGDAAVIRRVAAASLDLEPDAADLPALFSSAPGTRVTLVAEEAGEVTGIACGGLGTRPATARRGYVDLLAVAPAARCRGTGGTLLHAMEDGLRSAGAEQIWLGGNAPVYAWPGVDPRYTAMTCLAHRAGYELVREAPNMTVRLRTGPPGTGPPGTGAPGTGAPGTGPPGTGPPDMGALDADADERRLAKAGIRARRAAAGEAAAVADWLRGGPWGDSSWPEEAARAISADPPGCHVAVRDGKYLGFACHGVNRRAWFGPTGTLPAFQGQGIGTVLLRRCMADIAAAGHPGAEIAWVGPVRFYSRALGARIGRLFWIYTKAA